MRSNVHNLDFSDKTQPSNVKAQSLFDIEKSINLPLFEENNEAHILQDPHYHFQPEITQAICYALANNKTLYLHGLHGSGKSTHIEQIAAKLNWPTLRINLDSHITRIDLIGKDTITLENNQQVMKFDYGIIPASLQKPLILILDEYDAARAETQFILHRLLENLSAFPVIETGETIQPHPYFRLFATANTAGVGDESGLYQGTHLLNQGHMDRWNLVLEMPQLSVEQEANIIESKFSKFAKSKQKSSILKQMVQFSHLTRNAFSQQQLSLFISLRTLQNWAESFLFLNDPLLALKQTILTRFSKDDLPILNEFYQRCFNKSLTND